MSIIEVTRSAPIGLSSVIRGPSSENIPAIVSAGLRGNMLLGFDASGNVALYSQAFPSANPLFGTAASFSATTTLTNAQKGNVILAGGNAAFDININNPTGYDADWSVVVINTDVPGSGRRKRIVCSATSQTYNLFPEEWAYVKRQGTVLIFNPATKRWRPRLPVVINVHPTSGNDANDGLATGAGAFLTAQAAIDFLQKQDQAEGGLSIKLADGTYTAVGASVMNCFGANPNATAWAIVGNVTTPGNCIINAPAGFACWVVQDTTGVALSGVRLIGGAGSSGISLRQNSIADFHDIEFGTMSGGQHIGVTDNCQCSNVGTCSIIGNAATFAAASNNSVLNVGTITIPTARAFTVFASASFGGRVAGGSFSGAGVAGTTGQRFVEQFGGRVDSSVTYPGNAAGSSFDWPADGGTASLPVYAAANDIDTGNFRPAADRWGVSCAGVPRMTWGNAEGAGGLAYAAIDYAQGSTALSTKCGATGTTAENVLTFYDGANTLCGAITINPVANTAQYLTSSAKALKQKFDKSGIDWGQRLDSLWVGDYERKSNPGTIELGLVAEWTEQHLPGVVHEVDGTKMIDYGQTAPLALWAAKDARKRLSTLEKAIEKIDALEKRIAELDKRYKSKS
jgi:hypothetical protein